MRKCQCLVFVLKQSYICYYIICLTVPLKLFSIFTKKLHHRYGSSQQRCSIKTAVLKIFTKFTEKHLHWSFFLAFRPSILLKRDSNTSFFLLANFSEHLFWRASVTGCFNRYLTGHKYACDKSGRMSLLVSIILCFQRKGNTFVREHKNVCKAEQSKAVTVLFVSSLGKKTIVFSCFHSYYFRSYIMFM